jgi:hypothetical protein
MSDTEDAPIMSDTEDALEAHISVINIAQNAACQELKSRLTRSNFEHMVETHFPRIFGWRISGINMPSDDPEDDRGINQYAVTISINDDGCARGIMGELVRQIYPHVIMDRDQIDGYNGYTFHLVTKEAAERSKDEHGIRTVESFLEYALRNDIPIEDEFSTVRNARETFTIDVPAYSAWRAAQGRKVSGDEYCRLAHYLFRRSNALASACYEIWRADYYGSLWCNLHGRLLSLSLLLAQVRLTPYELLWVLDYISPMSFHYYKDGVPYDPNHRRKLRLFENVAQSYSRIKSGK